MRINVVRVCTPTPNTSPRNQYFMKRKKNMAVQLNRIEQKCDRMASLLTRLNRLVRGQVVDSLIDTMRQEALRMKELSRIERERTMQ